MPTREPASQWHVAECLLPGLTQASADSMALRVRAKLADRAGPEVVFLGSLLLPDDEVLLCLFEGEREDVLAVCDRAEVPYERVLTCVWLGLPVIPGGS